VENLARNSGSLKAVNITAYEPGRPGAAPRLGKTIIFRVEATFFGQKPAAKNGKIFFGIY